MEGADDLTLRAEEVDTFKACVNVDHIGDFFFGPALVDAYREMSKAAGSKKPNESQRAEAVWAMKAANDNGDPARKDNILGRSQTRQELWGEHLKDPSEALDKALRCLENPYQS